LNAVAAHMALLHSGLRIDSQGIAGSNSWPHLVGLEGRNVMVYADADSAGQGAVTRWTELARVSQAKSVRVVDAFDGSDFCNLAAKYGLEVFGSWLDLALA
jgi:putative DNA primase/helicase